MVVADGRPSAKSKRPAGANAGKPFILATAAPPDFPMNRRFNTYSLQEAAEESPTLASLAARARDAGERLRAVETLIPKELRPAIAAGPAEGDSWCLLVQGNAAAAKVRQLAPALLARLRVKGWDVASIRIKVQTRR
jgi:hypothetical protein